jgi:transaldolase
VQENKYLTWLANETPTQWWHDSADLDELRVSLACGATGVTTNPFLVNVALASFGDAQTRGLAELPGDPAEKAEALERHVVHIICDAMRAEFESSGGARGFVCAQVNPLKAADTHAMVTMARRFSGWAPNITVKLPATAAGLDAMEECVAEGISITMTVSFTVSQAIAIAESYNRGAVRATASGIEPRQCFAVLMIGRLDDYLREVAQDQGIMVSESDICQAGLAVAKRARNIYKERRYAPTLMVAALRSAYHATELSGADFILSLHPKIQAMLATQGIPNEMRIDSEVDPSVIQRLEKMSEFVSAYEPDGMIAEEFITYGATQRTLSQFIDSGWSLLESFRVE